MTVKPQHTARHIVAIDGEGVTLPDGEHLYTLLCAYDNRKNATYPKGSWTEIAAWESALYPKGLTTERILTYLLRLKRFGRTRSTVFVSYFFNYDVCMWVKEGLSDEQKTALWKSGAVHWRGTIGDDPRCYYLRWLPSKLFFCGVWTPDMEPLPDLYDWPGQSILIYDVSGFAQRSFVAALEDWQTSVDMAHIEEMKSKRAQFTAADREETTAYCRDECVALAEYVAQLDETFQSEGVRLSGWHGGGALATYYLKREGVAKTVRDSADPAILQATLAAYFGGRAEVQQMGRVESVYNYDLSSAYAAAARMVPNLVEGTWSHASARQFDPTYFYALWHVTWDTARSGRTIGPLPFRHKGGVYYPSRGSGWVHGLELLSAMTHFGEKCFYVTEGYVYHPTGGPSPFAFIEELAARRVAYKETDPKRALPYKYGLNSIYGKLAQHSPDAETPAPYQCYYAAGYITAWTRRKLLEVTYQDEHTDEDIVLYATDGVFCRHPRSWQVATGDELGMFSYKGCLDRVYFIQPGCWYASDGETRSRGFGKGTLTYPLVRDEWERSGIYGQIAYSERRFVGLGSCASTGDYSEYARWVDRERVLNFYPDRKFPMAGYVVGDPICRLTPMDMSGLESEHYVPHAPRDTSYALANLAELQQKWYDDDQPDMDS